MSFQFSFQKILHIADKEKKQLESEYQVVFGFYETLSNRLYSLMEQKESIQAAFRENLKSSLSIDAVQNQLNDISRLERMIDEQRIEYAQARERLEQFQLTLTEKTIQLKKYEKLKDHAWLEYKKDERKRDNKRMDELAAISFPLIN
ncbi:flagellar FliJ protein [Scopulibacillus darangshiensis]|uniref:Flagellar FliJ protein n=1 Tax=Scopulibacillus darangshiensis TaxID=442528 RepID=A0A4V2SMZ0_9BACL|nr:flagellar export protein FliJ [Scopulibacillus darangshiensis]TCP29186.1 flagellar FliJ protein [Scopulibacillus darangshiensis]